MIPLCHAYLAWIGYICYITISVNQDHPVSDFGSNSALFSGLTGMFTHARSGSKKLLLRLRNAAVCACPEHCLWYLHLSAHLPAETLQTYPTYTHLLYMIKDKQLGLKCDRYWGCGSKQNKSHFVLATLGYHLCRHCKVIRIYLDGC